MSDLHNFHDEKIKGEQIPLNLYEDNSHNFEEQKQNETELSFNDSSFMHRGKNRDKVSATSKRFLPLTLFDGVPHVFVIVRNRIVDHARGLDHENDVYDLLADINVCPQKCTFFSENYEYEAKIFQQPDGGIIYVWKNNVTSITKEKSTGNYINDEENDLSILREGGGEKEINAKRKDTLFKYNYNRGKGESYSAGDSTEGRTDKRGAIEGNTLTKDMKEIQNADENLLNQAEDWEEELYKIGEKISTDNFSEYKTASKVEEEVLITYRSSGEGLESAKEHEPTRSEAARFLAHLKTIRYAYYSKYKYVVLLEGDVHLEPWDKCSTSQFQEEFSSFPAFSIDDVVKALPSDWKILQLGYLLKSPVKTMQYQNAWANSIHATRRIHSSSDMTLQGAHAYAISARGMYEILTQYWPDFDKEEDRAKVSKAFAANVKHLYNDLIIDLRKVGGTNVLELSHILYNRDGVFTTTCPIFPYPLSLEYQKPNTWEPLALANFRSISSSLDRKSFQSMVMMDLENIINSSSRHPSSELLGNIDYIWFAMGIKFTGLSTPVGLKDLERVTDEMCYLSTNFKLCTNKFRTELQHLIDASPYFFIGNRKERDNHRNEVEIMIREGTSRETMKIINDTVTIAGESKEDNGKKSKKEELTDHDPILNYKKSYGSYLFFFEDRLVAISWERGMETCYEMTRRFCEEVAIIDPYLTDKSSCQKYLQIANEIDNRDVFNLSKEMRCIRPRYISSIDHPNSPQSTEEDRLQNIKHAQAKNKQAVDNTKPVSIIWHIAKIGSVWQDIVHDQWRLIRNSGLLDAVDNIYMSYLGSIVEDPLVEHPKVKSIISSESVKDYEFPTLDIVYEYCQIYPEGKLLYMHNKGASVADIDPAVFLLTQEWRYILEEYTIYRYEDCLRLLDTYVEGDDNEKRKYNTCGALWNEVPVSHYSGNFWWASCNYIRTLKPFSESERRNRFYAEDWLSSGGKSKTVDLQNHSSFQKESLNEEVVDWSPISCFNTNVDLYHTKIDQSIYRYHKSSCIAM